VNKTYLFFCEKRKLTKGLTLVEVIVGMLISALCLSTALQAYVAAVGVGVKAQDSNVVLKAIQSDLEEIRQKAQDRDCSIDASLQGGYAQKLMRQVQPRATETINNSDFTIVQGVTLSFPNVVPNDYRIDRKMLVNFGGLANATNVLQISYDVTRSDSPVAITKLNTAVMPDVAMVCP
jgi:prepilin-type N-terminal cleavage/methylation domain-containing protein